jgi:hypothetical protein
MVLYFSALTSFWAKFQYGEVSEGFKELVLKTSDSQEPWVRIPPSPPIKALRRGFAAGTSRQSE